MFITFPALYGIDYSIKGNPVRQIAVDRSKREGVLAPFTRGRLGGFVFQPGVVDEEVLIVPLEAKRLPDGHRRILRATVDPNAQSLDLSDGTWLRHPLRHVEEGQVDHEHQIAECLESWIGAFSYVQEDPQRQVVGLRNPQLGALHAIHAHWSVTDATATIVMPTGTGKTEVMLSILVSYRCPKLLVVAPTDALRAQLAEKFATLGVLKVSGCTLLNANSKHPVVCMMHHIPDTPDEVDYIFARSHVIVTTSMVVGQSQESVQNRMAHHCPYFFIDEAHHAEAATWVAFKEKFKERRVVQFTATPFREDGKHLDGDIIYKYPLKKAQEEGYFKPIRFEPVVAFNRKKADHQLAEWCKEIGAKVLDETINPDQVLAGTLESQTLLVRPAKMPIGIDWPEEIYTTPEGPWSVVIGGAEFPLSEISIDLLSPSQEGTLRLAVSSEDKRGELGLELYEEDEAPNYRFLLQSDERVQIKRGGRAEPEDISDFFYDNPPVIWFADGSALEGNQYVELKNVKPPYNAAKIQAWDWTGTDIQKESQGTEKRADSVQARVIRELRERGYNMIIDDDGKGEVADVVAIRIQGELTAPTGIEVEFYHCKYSGGAEPGQRIDDLYEVCGQAQKSIRWMCSSEKRSDMFTHLLRREANREEAGLASRYEVGDAEMLQTIREMSYLCLVKLTIHIVQPGLSKARATLDQLELLSVTENHLTEIYDLPFVVIASS